MVFKATNAKAYWARAREPPVDFQIVIKSSGHRETHKKEQGLQVA